MKYLQYFISIKIKHKYFLTILYKNTFFKETFAPLITFIFFLIYLDRPKVCTKALKGPHTVRHKLTGCV